MQKTKSCLLCAHCKPGLMVECHHPKAQYKAAFTERENGQCKGKLFERRLTKEAK
mgnify:CR=1 FL=1